MFPTHLSEHPVSFCYTIPNGFSEIPFFVNVSVDGAFWDVFSVFLAFIYISTSMKEKEFLFVEKNILQ